MGASKFGCCVLWLRNCSIYLDYHKWMLQNLDETSASLWISFSGLDENPMELYQKLTIHWNL